MVSRNPFSVPIKMEFLTVVLLKISVCVSVKVQVLTFQRIAVPAVVGSISSYLPLDVV